MIKTSEPSAAMREQDHDPAQRSLLSFVLFAVVALILLFTIATQLLGVSFGDRDLIDTDGYMRYLRVEALLDEGEWFDPLFTRSNHPFGETSHWTRPLDLYVAGLALILRPFLGPDALYWAAVWNGPLMFAAIAATAYWALKQLLPSQVRNLVMPAVLAIPSVFLYSAPGRVDHHGAILVAVLGAIGWLMRVVEGDGGRAATWLGTILGLGMWLSVEFAVAVALTAATLAAAVATRDGPGLAWSAARVFGWASLTMAVALLIERGGAWRVVEVDRLSIAHVALGGSIALAFVLFAHISARLAGKFSRFAALSGYGVVSVAVVLLVFPQLTGGPLGMVDPEVRRIWLDRVAELRPIADYGSAAWPMMVTTPIVVGLLAGALLIKRRSPRALMLTSWLVVYAGLTVVQVRWGLFADMLALPLVVAAVAPLYERLGRSSAAVILRPTFFLVVILAIPVSVILSGSPTAVAAQNCTIASAIESVKPWPTTTVLAYQDPGPEILYRTPHNVIATPYHRNEDGILFVRDTMSMTPNEAHPHLMNRDVGLILLCPERDDLTRPLDPTGTLYEALLTGPSPPWARQVTTPPDTDYQLFEVIG